MQGSSLLLTLLSSDDNAGGNSQTKSTLDRYKQPKKKKMANIFDDNLTDSELENSINQDIDKIIELFDKRFKNQEESLDTITKTIILLEIKKSKDLELLWNIAGYINIISYDIKIITRDLYLAKSEWQKRHYARQIYLIIYESLDDIFDLLGKDFVDLIKNRLDIAELQEELKNIRSQMNKFKKKYSKGLKTIRNVSIAHRDKKALNQIKVILQLKWLDAIRISIDYEDILHNLESLLTKIVRKGMVELSELKPDN